MFCSHCGNEVKVQAANCPYCEKPLGKSLATAKSTRSCITLGFFLVTFAMFAVAAYYVVPQVREVLSIGRDKQQPQESSTPARNAASDELQLRSLYQSYVTMLANPNPQELRRFVPSSRLKELDERGESSGIYDELIPDVSMDGILIKRIEVKGNRAVIATNVETAGGFTDDKGNALGATGVAQLIHEDDGWKFFSQMWHISPPTDPVAPAILWLDGSS